MKKILAIVTTFALLPLFVGVSALSTPTAQITTINTPVKSGDSVRFSVVISQYENAYATITVSDLEYDANLLHFEGFEASEKNFTNALSSSNSSEFSLISAPANQTSANGLKGGECCVLIFTAKTDIVKNTRVFAKVSANGYAKGCKDNWIEYTPLSVKVTAGGIAVSNENTQENSYVNSQIHSQKITSTDAQSVAPLGDENKLFFVGFLCIFSLILGLFFMRKHA